MVATDSARLKFGPVTDSKGDLARHISDAKEERHLLEYAYISGLKQLIKLGTPRETGPMNPRNFRLRWSHKIVTPNAT